MHIEAALAALTALLPQGRIWCEASHGEITVETGLRHKWPATIANRIKIHFPKHSVTLLDHGHIRLHTGLTLAEIPL